MKPLAVVLFVATAAVPGLTYSSTMFSGAGAHTCGQFAEDYRKAPLLAEAMYSSWAQGFMSALNIPNPSDPPVNVDLGSASVDEQKAFLRKYCSEHPLDDFYKAVMQLYFSLKPGVRSPDH